MILAINFNDTITLGGGLIALAIGVSALVRALLVAPTKIENANIRRRLQDCQDEVRSLADECERKDLRLNQLGAEKDKALTELSGSQARCEELQSQIAAMPDWPAVQKFTLELLEHVDKAAAERQNTLAEQIARTAAESRNENAERYEALQAAHAAILEATRELVREVREGRKA